MNSGYLNLAVQAATEAGALLQRGFGRPVDVLDESGRDIKTGADHAAERHILHRLAPSGFTVLTEETGLHPVNADETGLRWIVDPLDGTLNYARGLPLCVVSIGLWRGSEPILGVVHEFLHDRLYTGVVGEGAWCNSQPICVSSVNTPAQAIIATGFPAAADHGENALSGFVHRLQRFKKVRLLGAAALSLAQVAAGTVDVYAENSIRLWDVAAGLALVKAAGGTYRVGSIDSRWCCDVVAENGHIRENNLV